MATSVAIERYILIYHTQLVHLYCINRLFLMIHLAYSIVDKEICRIRCEVIFSFYIIKLEAVLFDGAKHMELVISVFGRMRFVFEMGCARTHSCGFHHAMERRGNERGQGHKGFDH